MAEGRAIRSAVKEFGILFSGRTPRRAWARMSCAEQAPPSGAQACCRSSAAPAFSRLLAELSTLKQLPISEAFAPGTIRNTIRRVGLQPTDRVVKDGHARFGHSMYGEEAQYSINLTQISPRERSSKRAFGVAGQIGMWQVPQQFECLVRALAQHGPFRRSVCVGTWSGWTDVMLAAYLRRLSPGNLHTTFDVSDYTSPCIKSLFSTMDVRMVKNGWYGGRESWPALGLQAEWDGSWPANFSQPVLDFCMPHRPRTPD
jgi:hypothetical protein